MQHRFSNATATTRTTPLPTGKFLRLMTLGLAGWLAAGAVAGARTHKMNTDETGLFKKIASTSAQKRAKVTLDPILCLVARQRAEDMARKNYFGHINLQGMGPNFLVQREGYQLPTYYDASRSGNNLESIAMGTTTANETFTLWLQSAGHRPHVLAEVAFFQDQTSVGVGVFRSTRPPYAKYSVFLSAPPNGALLPQAITLVDAKGKLVPNTQQATVVKIKKSKKKAAR